MNGLYLSPYVGVLALIYLLLSVHVIRLRRRKGMAAGDGGDIQLARAIRAHAHFAEYVPFCLIILWLLAALGTASLLVHTLAGLLVASRLLHPYSLLIAELKRNHFRCRVASMLLTFLILGVGGLLLLLAGFTASFAQ